MWRPGSPHNRLKQRGGNATVLHCKGYQVGDRHRLTDQVINLDIKRSVVVSIRLVGFGQKDVINAPVVAGKHRFSWFYDAIKFKYVLSKELSSLQIFSETGDQLGIFDCLVT